MSRSLSLPFLLISPILTLALGVWVLTTALQMTIGTPQQTEDLLNKSGVYQAVIPAQVADAQAANPSLQNLPLQNPEIQKILGNSLDAQNLQQQGNHSVEAVYSWLEGKTAKPQINIVVMANQQQLAQAAGNYAMEFASKLPACGPGEADYSTLQSDPLSIKCLPAGFDAATIRSTVQNAVATNPALGSSTALTENDVKLPNGKTIVDSFNTAPKWYQRAQKLPLWSAVTAAVCILLILLILRPVAGIKSVGKHLLVVAIVLSLISFGLAWVLKLIYTPFNDNSNINTAINKLSDLFNAAYRGNIIHQSEYLAVAGVALIVVALILRRLHRAAAPARVTTTAQPVSPPLQPESLGTTPTTASFIPLGPPKLPATKAASKSSAKSSTRATKAKAPAKKKPAAKRTKKKK